MKTSYLLGIPNEMYSGGEEDGGGEQERDGERGKGGKRKMGYPAMG